MRSWECRAPAVSGRAKRAQPGFASVDVHRLIRSFRFAVSGALHVLQTEQNMRVHVILGVLVVLLGAFLRISTSEWGLVLLCIGAVMAAECFNSSVERLADRLSQDEHYLIRVAKDAAAGGVLMTSLSAAAVGALVFLPKLWSKFMAL